MTSHKHATASEHLLIRNIGAKFNLVSRHHLTVDIFHARSVDHLIFKSPLIFVVFQSPHLFAIKLYASVPLPQKDLAILASSDDMIDGWLDVKHENQIVFASRIDNRNFGEMHRGHRIAAKKVNLLEILDVMSADAAESSNIAIILNADHQLATRCVCERADMLRQLIGVFARAFAVEILAFFLR